MKGLTVDVCTPHYIKLPDYLQSYNLSLDIFTYNSARVGIFLRLDFPIVKILGNLEHTLKAYICN